MIIRSLKVKNVKCFEDSEVEFVLGKNVIIGYNGSGKSALLQSVLYSLFSEYTQGTNDRLVRTGQPFAEFELEFEHDGREYLVERKLPVKGAGNAFLIDKKTNEEKARTQSGVSREIARLLGVKKEVFRDVILVQQGEIAEIVDMKPRDRKILFDKLLGIYDYELAWNRCSRIEKMLKTKMERSKELVEAHTQAADKLLSRKTRLSELRGKLKQKRKTLPKKVTEHRTQKKKLSALERMSTRIGKLETSIKGREETLVDINRDFENSQSMVINCCSELQIPQPKRNTVATLDAFKIRMEKKYVAACDRVSSTRSTYGDFLKKSEIYKEHQKQQGDMSIEIGEFRDSIQESEYSLFEGLPALKNQPRGQWVKIIKIESTKAKKQTIKMSEALDSAKSLVSRKGTLSGEVKAFRKNASKLNDRLKENDTKATSEVGEDWVKLAREKPEQIDTQITEVEGILNSAEGELTKATQQVADTLSKKNGYLEDIAGLSDIKGKECPRCKQFVDDTHAAKLLKALEGDLGLAEKELELHQTTETKLKLSIEAAKARSGELAELKHRIKQAQTYNQNRLAIEKDFKTEKKRVEGATRDFEKVKLELSEISIEKIEEALEGLRERSTKLGGSEVLARTVIRDAPKLERKEEEFNALQREITKLEKLSLDSRVPELLRQIEELEHRRDTLKSLAEELARFKGHISRRGKLNGILNDEEMELSGLERRYDPVGHETVKESVASLQSSVSTLKQAMTTIKDEQIPEADDLYKESKNAADTIKNLRKEHELAEESLKVLNKLREFYREVQRPLRRRDLDKASRHASEIFRTLIGSNEFGKIKITEDHELLVSRFGALELMSDLSGGEQVLACLAVRLGFARALVSSDLLILDEPTAFLDDRRKAELVETLYKVSPAKQMVIVTHDDEFQRVAQRLIHVEKDQSTLISHVSWS